MKTNQTIVALALSSVALLSGAVSAGNYPSNPERDVIDQASQSTTAVATIAGARIDFGGVSTDGWKDVGGERGDKFVGNVSATSGDGHAFTNEELMQARMDYRNAN